MANISLKNVLRPGFVGRTFKSGYRFQRYWDTPMATAFFCGESGAGVFIVSMLLNFMPGVILGLLITGVGKTFFHLSHMGVPSKSWRAILRPDRSWISRGLWGIIFFVGFGVIHVISELFGLVPEVLIKPAYFLGLAGAIVVVVYQGFAMSHSTAISLWNTGLMPLSSMLYGLLSGVSMVMALGVLDLYATDESQLLMVTLFQKILLVAVFMTILSLLHGAKHGSKGARQSYELLTSDFLARPFLIGVIGIGTIMPFLLLMFAPVNFLTTLTATVSILFGFYLYRVLIFKAGVMDPILTPADMFGK